MKGLSFEHEQRGGTNISLYFLTHTVKEDKYEASITVYVDKAKIEGEFSDKAQSKYYKWK